eukprot:g7688.t1
MVFLSSSDEDTTIVGIRLCFRDEWNGEEVLYYHHWDRLSKIDITVPPLFTAAFEARLQEKTRSLFGAPKIDEPIVQGYGAELSSPAAPHRHLNAKLQNLTPAVEDSTFSAAARSASLRVEDLGLEEEGVRSPGAALGTPLDHQATPLDPDESALPRRVLFQNEGAETELSADGRANRRRKEKQNKGPSTDLFVPLPVGWSEHYISCDMVTTGSSASPSQRPSQQRSSPPVTIRIRVRRLELLERAEECIALPSLPTGLAAVGDRRRLDLELQYFCQTRLRPFCEKRQISCALWFPVLRLFPSSLNTRVDDHVDTPPDTISTPPASKDSALHRVEAADSKSSTPTLSSSVIMSRTVTSSALAFSTAKIGVADHPRAGQNIPSGRLVWSSKTSDGRRSASTRRGLSSSSSASSAAQFAVGRASPSGAEPRQSENKTRLTNCSDKLWLFLVSTGGHGYRMQSLSLDHTVADGKMLQWVVEKEKGRGDVGGTKQVELRNYVRPEWMCDPSGDFLRRRLGIETVGPTAHRPASSSQTPGKEQAGFLPRYAATTERATQTSVACVCLAGVLSLSGYCSVFAVVLFAYLLCVFRMAPELFWRPTLLLRKKRTFAVIGVCLVGLELVWLVWGGAAAPPRPEPDTRFFWGGAASEAEARWKVRDLDPTDRNAYGQEERRIASTARTAGREGKQQETDADPYTYTPAASRTSTTTFSSGWQRRPRAQENEESAGGAATRGTPLLPRQEEEVAAGEEDEELEEVDDADEDDETDEGVDELPESGRGLPEASIDAVAAAEASLSVSDADDVVQEEMEQEQEREGELPSEEEQIGFPQEQEDGELEFRPYAARQRAGSEYVEGNPWVLLGIALAIGYATQQGWLFSDEVDD